METVAKKNKAKDYIFLHIVLLFYSVIGILSKIASQNPLFSIEFLSCYSLMILGLALYAVFWQKLLKKIPLTTAFSNKSITIIWGMVWGTLIFKEQITVKMILGSIVILFGVYLVVTENE